MKIRPATKFLTAIAIVFLFLTALSCSNGSTYIPPNEGVVNYKDFYVSSNNTSLNTSARGTVFVEKDKSNNYKAQIVAWVEIDPMDWGGVEFDIPSGWKVTHMTSSYPNSSTNESSLGILEGGYQSVVIENKIYAPWSPSGGGSGSVVIELAANPQGQKPSEALEIMVAVGSNESDGVQIMHPDYETIAVPIIQQ